MNFALYQGWKHREELRHYLCDSNKYTDKITNLVPQELKNRGIKVLILDFDGVLAAHGDELPLPEVLAWLRSAVDVFRENVFILTNKPLEARKNFFADQFGEISFLAVKKKKPYPDGIQQVIINTGHSSKDILVVDDRLLTGILAAILAGASGCLVKKPFANKAAKPFIETFFALLRYFERRWFK